MTYAASPTFYSIAVKDMKRQPFDLGSLRGKVVLIVNVASLGLEHLYQTYKDQGFVVLGFPANDFFQEPSETLAQTCQVNGSSEHELYKFLKSQKPGVLGLGMVKWNFEKFLVDREGNVVDRFLSNVTPEALEPRLVEVLGGAPTGDV
ncbi:hypothetical protein HDU67_009779 [Dinochytrium kinnereticum]|nr:hypothetical protein HDU67_009779 [Dinochytrium kinnereticum]